MTVPPSLKLSERSRILDAEVESKAADDEGAGMGAGEQTLGRILWGVEAPAAVTVAKVGTAGTQVLIRSL